MPRAIHRGKFISNQRPRYRNGGIAFELELVKRVKKVNGDGSAQLSHIDSFGYLPVWVYKPITKKGTLFTLVPASVDPVVMMQLQMSVEERSKMSQFLEDTHVNLEGHREVEPYWMH